MTLLVVDRYHPRRRRELQFAVDAGHIEKCSELALLEPDQLRPLAQLSLQLLVIGLIFFVALDLVAYFWLAHGLFKGVAWASIVLWLGINIIGYFIILPIHEAIHGLTILFWGGRPHFGAKLPLALFCGARQQIFPRDQYLIIALAPLIVISVAGIILTLLVPSFATYALFAIAGNVSGSAGDLLVVRQLCRFSRNVLVEDTETGYCAWEVAD